MCVEMWITTNFHTNFYLIKKEFLKFLENIFVWIYRVLNKKFLCKSCLSYLIIRGKLIQHYFS